MWEGHSGARSILHSLFHAEVLAVDTLTDEALEDADMICIHTTAAFIPLSDAEQRCMAEYCHKGGTAILNCFSNWSAHGGDGSESVAFLGLGTVARAGFGEEEGESLNKDPTSAAADLTTSGPLGASVEAWARHLPELDLLIGSQDELYNKGHTMYRTNGLIAAGRVVPLSTDWDRQSARRQVEGLRGLSWIPAACERGQALICSNMHWMADDWAWDGGYIGHKGNYMLFGNVCAAACRAL